VKDGFLWPEHRGFWHVESDPQKLISSLENYQPPSVDKWIHREEI